MCLMTDARLRAALAEVTEKASVIIVAQRISTIIHADQILVLDDGKIVGKGTHEELLKNCDVYMQIAQSQLSARELGIDDKFKAEYQNVIDALQNTFKISEAQGISLADMSNSDFTNYYLKIKEYGKSVQ